MYQTVNYLTTNYSYLAFYMPSFSTNYKIDNLAYS